MTVMGALGGLFARGVWTWLLATRLCAPAGRQLVRISAAPGRTERFMAQPWSRYSLYGVIGLVLVVLPLVLGQYWNYTLGTIGIYVLVGPGA